jgi:hypothetical protein
LPQKLHYFFYSQLQVTVTFLQNDEKLTASLVLNWILPGSVKGFSLALFQEVPLAFVTLSSNYLRMAEFSLFLILKRKQSGRSDVERDLHCSGYQQKYDLGR